MKQIIKQSFNLAASTYDAAAGFQTQVAKGLVQRLHSISPVPSSVLEIGCGTGILSESLTTHFPHSQILLTDIAPSMIEKCKERFNSNSRVQFLCRDGEELSFTSCYDLIVSSMTLHWFAHIKKSFTTLMNFLAQQGQFIFAMLGSHSLLEVKSIFTKANFNIPTPAFPSQALLKKLFPDMVIEAKIIKKPYKNLYDFLTSLKKLGAIAPSYQYSSLSAGKLRNLFRQYHTELEITYEVLYGRYIKR